MIAFTLHTQTGIVSINPTYFADVTDHEHTQFCDTSCTINAEVMVGNVGQSRRHLVTETPTEVTTIHNDTYASSRGREPSVPEPQPTVVNRATAQTKIMETLTKAMTKFELSSATGYSVESVGMVLLRLFSEGKVTNIGDGRYAKISKDIPF